MSEITSSVWGSVPEPITQGFGVQNPSTAYMYDYAEDYGWAAGTHIGLDIGVPKGTPIHAAKGGKVIRSGMSDSFRPNPVWIQQDDGQIAIYGHLWSDTVAVDDEVKPGQLIGYSGEQTKAGTMIPDGTGPHLHFELRRPDGTTGQYRAVDPTAELTGSTDYIPSAADGKFENQGGAPYAQLGFQETIDNATAAAPAVILRGLLFVAGAALVIIGALAATGNLGNAAKVALL